MHDHHHRRLHRSTLRLAVAVVALAAALLASLGAGAADGAQIKQPKRLKPGKMTTLQAVGLPPNLDALLVRIQPVSHRGSPHTDTNGMLLRKDRFDTNKRGRMNVRFRFPKRRFICNAKTCPAQKPWRRGGRVDVEVLRFGFPPIRLAHRVSRIKQPRLRRCGDLVVTPQSDNVFGNIRTRGIRCRPARRKLRRWAKNGYRPRSGPRGYRCHLPTHTDPGPTRCNRKGRPYPVIKFRGG